MGSNKFPYLYEYKPNLFTRALTPEQALYFNLDCYAEKVYHIIAQRTGGGFIAKGVPLTIRQLSILGNMSKAKVSESIKALKDKQLIAEVTTRENKRNITYYRLIYDPTLPLSESQLAEVNEKLKNKFNSSITQGSSGSFTDADGIKHWIDNEGADFTL